jgi:hypothetical protein
MLLTQVGVGREEGDRAADGAGHDRGTGSLHCYEADKQIMHRQDS